MGLINRERTRRFMDRMAARKGTGDRDKKAWYRIRAESNDEADIFLYDEISMWGISAEEFIKDLNGITAKTINLRINSPGGDVFDGTAIFNALREHPAKVVTHIDGLAASMASVVALSGDEVKMADNAFFMVHYPFSVCIGNAEDMRKDAAVLDKIGTAMVSTYAKRSGRSEEQVREWMANETWFNAGEAKDAGFVTEIEEGKDGDGEPGAKFDLSIYGKVPDELKEEGAGLGAEKIAAALRKNIEIMGGRC